MRPLNYWDIERTAIGDEIRKAPVHLPLTFCRATTCCYGNSLALGRASVRRDRGLGGETYRSTCRRIRHVLDRRRPRSLSGFRKYARAARDRRLALRLLLGIETRKERRKRQPLRYLVDWPDWPSLTLSTIRRRARSLPYEPYWAVDSCGRHKSAAALAVGALGALSFDTGAPSAILGGLGALGKCP